VILAFTGGVVVHMLLVFLSQVSLPWISTPSALKRRSRQERWYKKRITNIIINIF
jgi:hypothetical protein